MAEAIARKPDLHFWLRPVDEVTLRDFQPSNETGALVIDRQLFNRFDEIRDVRFAGCLVARRPMDLVQKIKVDIDGHTYHWEFDHTKLCGWRSMGIEPVLEIENEVTEEKWWYVYRFHSSGGWMWCQLLPHLGANRGFQLEVQGSRFFTLLIYLVYILVLYGIASIGFVMLMASLIGS